MPKQDLNVWAVVNGSGCIVLETIAWRPEESARTYLAMSGIGVSDRATIKRIFETEGARVKAKVMQVIISVADEQVEPDFMAKLGDIMD